MIALSTLRRDKKAEILHLAEIHGCRNVRVFLWDLENLSGVEVDLVESGSAIHTSGGGSWRKLYPCSVMPAKLRFALRRVGEALRTHGLRQVRKGGGVLR